MFEDRQRSLLHH